MLISKEHYSDANSLINGDLPFDPVRYEDEYKTRHADFFFVHKIDESYHGGVNMSNYGESTAGAMSTYSRRKKKKDISKQQLVMLIRSMQA